MAPLSKINVIITERTSGHGAPSRCEPTMPMDDQSAPKKVMNMTPLATPKTVDLDNFTNSLIIHHTPSI
ncbi:hypothetical protein D3C86_1891680 [compost metagenome]